LLSAKLDIVNTADGVLKKGAAICCRPRIALTKQVIGYHANIRYKSKQRMNAFTPWTARIITFSGAFLTGAMVGVSFPALHSPQSFVIPYRIQMLKTARSTPNSGKL
jgi:hypothetical protein